MTDRGSASARDAVLARIGRTQREFRRRVVQDQDHPLLDVQLTMTQLKLLIVVAGAERASVQSLARRSRTSLATMSGIVDRLAGQGLLARREDPADRRVRLLELTPAGAQLVQNVLEAGDAYRDRMLQRLDTAELLIVEQAFELLLRAVPEPPEPD